MKVILESITRKKLSDSGEDSLESLFLGFKKYYEKNGRHKYSEVSRIIYSLDDSEIDVLTVNLNLLVEYSEGKNENGIIRNIKKLIDHADLAHYQRKYIEDKFKETKVKIEGINKSNKSISNELSNSFNELEVVKKDTLEASEKLNKTEEKMERNYNNLISKIDEHMSSVYTQFVTILGIFTAIIFGVFGGMEILGNVMSNISTVKMSKLLIFSSLIIGAILTIIYMLLIGIANITNLSIRNCGCKKSECCEHTLFQKHPIYLIGMISSLYLFIIGIIAHEYERIDLRGIPYLNKFMENEYSLIVSAIVLLIVLIFMFYYINKKTQKNSGR